MSLKNVLFEELQTCIFHHNIISISGESSTGKTTLALQLVSNLMESNEIMNKQCIWIQASEEFPKRRLEKMYVNLPETLSYLLKNIFVIPKGNPFSDISSQSSFFRNFNSLVLPPGIKYIVIDNISHHLRLAQANISKLSDKMRFMNEFFNCQLFPLVMFCLREGYHLFFIHEVSFDPQIGQLRAYNNQLFERVKGVKILLSKSINTQLKSIKISSANKTKKFTYEISDQGLILL